MVALEPRPSEASPQARQAPVVPVERPAATPEVAPEPTALDVFALARGALAKRLAPVVAGVVVVAVIVYVISR